MQTAKFTRPVFLLKLILFSFPIFQAVKTQTFSHCKREISSLVIFFNITKTLRNVCQFHERFLTENITKMESFQFSSTSFYNLSFCGYLKTCDNEVQGANYFLEFYTIKRFLQCNERENTFADNLSVVTFQETRKKGDSRK